MNNDLHCRVDNTNNPKYVLSILHWIFASDNVFAAFSVCENVTSSVSTLLHQQYDKDDPPVNSRRMRRVELLFDRLSRNICKY